MSAAGNVIPSMHIFFLVKDFVDIIQCKIAQKVLFLADPQKDGAFLWMAS